MKTFILSIKVCNADMDDDNICENIIGVVRDYELSAMDYDEDECEDEYAPILTMKVCVSDDCDDGVDVIFENIADIVCDKFDYVLYLTDCEIVFYGNS